MTRSLLLAAPVVLLGGLWVAMPAQAAVSTARLEQEAGALLAQDKFEQAGQLLQGCQTACAGSDDYWLMRAAVQEHARAYIEAIASYDRILARRPQHVEAMRRKIQAIDSLGMPDQAIALAEQHPQVMQAADWQRLYSDRAAYAVRAAGEDEPDRAIHRELLATAIRRCDEALQYIHDKAPADRAALQQVRFDRMLAYGLAGDHRRVLEEYEALQQEGASLRDDTIIVVAESRLHEQQPQAAVALLQPLVQRQPDDAHAALLLFYAWLECEEPAKAREVLSGVMARQPAFIRGRDSREVAPNWDRVAAESAGIMLDAWSGDLAKAHGEIRALLEQAPANAALQANLAAIESLRGWPRQSLATYRQILLQTPSSFDARSGILDPLMALNEFREVEQRTLELARDYPESKAAENRAEDWRIHNLNELRVTVGLGESSGGSYGNHDLSADVWLFSSPLDYDNRAFFHTSSTTGSFREGEGQIDRYGAGVERRVRDHQYTLEVNRSYASEADTGVSLATDWFVDDRWTLSGNAQSFSAQTPVRAYNAGITASSAELGARYRVDDVRQYRLTTGYMDFSDDNRRSTLGATAEQVIYRDMYRQWQLSESLYTSRNTQDNTIYFNPGSDWSAGIAAEYTGVLRRHYDRQFSHKLLVGIGTYSQQGYGAGATAELNYRQIWQQNRTLEWFYGASLASHPYDGDTELRKALFGGFTWKFD